jgi:hypothetical protein
MIRYMRLGSFVGSDAGWNIESGPGNPSGEFVDLRLDSPNMPDDIVVIPTTPIPSKVRKLRRDCWFLPIS